jgi:hypothetical protein
VGDKTCFKCGESKSLSDFYKHKKMADGHLNKCKECTKSDVWHHRRDNVERIRDYDRERSKKPEKMAAIAANTAAYRIKYPERYRANAAVNNAMRRGVLNKLPCFICGAEDVEAHHADYSRPLDVIWLCPAHHKEIHLAFPEDHYERTTAFRG